MLEFENVDCVKRDMLEKEIDSFRRESYIEQFAELERKFEIKTLRVFKDWPQFVELSQRRNIMTHNDGRVSQQYLLVCEREGFVFSPRPLIGEKLELSNEYLEQANLIVGKVGFMLTHTLWRKVLPDNFDEANTALNNSIYFLLQRKRWDIAAEFGIFGLSEQLVKGVGEMPLRIRLINTAIGLKHSGRVQEAVSRLDSLDWSACVRDFNLAIAVLKGDYQEAARIMRLIGKQGELVTQLNYHLWPLFEDFRDSKSFQDAYKSIFGDDYLIEASKEAQIKSKDLMAEVSAETTPKDRPRLRKTVASPSKGNTQKTTKATK